MNPVVRTLSPQRWLDQGDNKLGFLVVGRGQIALAKEFFEIIEKLKSYSFGVSPADVLQCRAPRPNTEPWILLIFVSSIIGETCSLLQFGAYTTSALGTPRYRGHLLN